jgi:hypothetical protein
MRFKHAHCFGLNLVDPRMAIDQQNSRSHSFRFSSYVMHQAAIFRNVSSSSQNTSSAGNRSSISVVRYTLQRARAHRSAPVPQVWWEPKMWRESPTKRFGALSRTRGQPLEDIAAPVANAPRPDLDVLWPGPARPGNYAPLLAYVQPACERWCVDKLIGRTGRSSRKFSGYFL